MLQTEIRREKLHTILDEELPSVCDEARELLGYAAPDIAKEIKPNPLADTLARLEIEVLNWRDVIAYQLERRQEREREELAVMLVADQMPGLWGRHRTDWSETEINKYRGIVPAHVLQKAIEIKRALPEVEIFVEHLSETPDPFLVAKMTGEDGYSWNAHVYYIDVWDEPKFERR